ncbi:transcription elongation factor TFIIS-like [Bidens hawaiensis]|uniref:transcription elongation factor TFIIS-like n=1 Tax=Bidens hawaiensis TaxID=980011 RepID=UPI00404B77DC
MERELIELFESAKKNADAVVVSGDVETSPEEDRCVDALITLKKFPVNYQILVSTQVGKRLRQLTKHPRKKIQSVASELVEIWKAIIVQETVKNKKNENLDIKKSTSMEKKVQRTNSVKVEKTEITKVEKVNVVKVEKKPMTNDVPPLKLNSLVYCKDPLRDKIRELLAEALCKVSGEVDNNNDDELKVKVTSIDPYRVAVSVETAMFEKWGKSNGAQKFKYRSIMFNVKDPKNPDFRRKILVGEFKPERVVELTPEEMASTERQMQNVKIKEKALFDCERGGPPKATTDQFKCGRCGKRKCTYYQLQTRSADEPMTTFVTCVNCDNHWKFC